MDQTNISMPAYFIISGFSDLHMVRVTFFLVVLLIYLFTLGGNMTIVLLVCQDPSLHTPMYFFLVNLSVLDICSSTISLHKVLIDFISGDNTVSVLGCLVQIFMFLSMSCNELLILTAMSYDRYVAICNPLHYHTIMSCKVCAFMAIACWAMSFSENTPTFMGLIRIICYKANRINHFFCDVVPVIKVSCSDTSFLELYMTTAGVFIAGIPPFLFTFASYFYIIATILRIPSSIGRRKAFYTCSSHLTVVILLYTTLIFQYLTPYSVVNLDSKKFSSLFNTAAVPILNPLVYSLKNKDVIAAFRRQIKIANFCQEKDHKERNDTNPND
ncbi:olfactory receptor 8D1-like [Pseudophryne corroboree]|uniref:olfactory receptor 8D1-like n=1 Tax=Pseudophryne corroboree TaxID=495146 RepID=UPI0030812AAA